jgi:hypothetical protein
MKLSIVGFLIGVLLIVVAIFEFDSSSWTRICISVLLFLSGLYNIVTEIRSRSIR